MVAPKNRRVSSMIAVRIATVKGKLNSALLLENDHIEGGFG
jgi:hypothetical protein